MNSRSMTKIAIRKKIRSPMKKLQKRSIIHFSISNNIDSEIKKLKNVNIYFAMNSRSMAKMAICEKILSAMKKS